MKHASRARKKAGNGPKSPASEITCEFRRKKTAASPARVAGLLRQKKPRPGSETPGPSRCITNAVALQAGDAMDAFQLVLALTAFSAFLLTLLKFIFDHQDKKWK